MSTGTPVSIKPPEKKVSSTADRLKKIRDQRTQLDNEEKDLLNGLRDELLGEINIRLETLKANGFSYEVTEITERAKKSKGSGIKRTKDPNTPCNICKFVTNPPHDARAHRTQAPKKPFTTKELEERGLEKVNPTSKATPQ